MPDLGDVVPILLEVRAGVSRDLVFGDVVQCRSFENCDDRARRRAPEQSGSVGFGRRYLDLGGDGLHRNRRPGVPRRFGPHRDRNTSTGPQDAQHLAHHGGNVGKEHQPEATTDGIERRVGKRQVVDAGLADLDVRESAALLRVGGCGGEHAGREIGQHDAPTLHARGDRQAGFAGARRDFEMLAILAQVELTDHLVADRPQHAEHEPVPLCPAGRERVPGLPLLGANIVSVRHVASSLVVPSSCPRAR